MIGDPRPDLSIDAVARFLAERLGGSIDRLEPLRPGELSRVFAFEAGGEPRVVRFNVQGDGFAKDRLAYERFASPDLPIPRVDEIGQYGALAYCISQRLPGTPTVYLSPDEYARARPALMATLARIHALEPPGPGYGPVTSEGRGVFPSWRTYIASIADDDQPGFWHGWRALLETTFLERDLWERLHARMLDLLACCPDERRVVHGDYGYDNVLAEDGRVTGVLDWEGMRYGDPLYDVAYLQLYLPGNEAIVDPAAYPDYASRRACYLLYMALDGLRFYAKTDQPAKYAHLKDRLVALQLDRV